MTTAKRGLNAAKVHLAKTEAALQKSFEALETERKAWLEADREVLALRGQVLGVEESNARLLEKLPSRRKDSPSSRTPTLVCTYYAFG